MTGVKANTRITCNVEIVGESFIHKSVVALAGLSAILLLYRHWNIAGVLAVSSAAALAMKFALE